MEEQCGPLSREYCYPEEENEELRCSALYTSGLDTTFVTAKEELARREFELISFKDILCRSVKEKDEAQTQSQKLILENVLLQQRQQQTQEATAILSAISSPIGSNKDIVASSVTDPKHIVPSSFTEPNPQQSIHQALPKAVRNLAAERPLPEKGELLKAVMEAGPLLQTLLLTGPLPQWQHPPPQLDSIEIPPVVISSPSPRLSQQASLNSISGGSARKGDWIS